MPYSLCVFSNFTMTSINRAGFTDDGDEDNSDVIAERRAQILLSTLLSIFLNLIQTSYNDC